MAGNLKPVLGAAAILAAAGCEKPPPFGARIDGPYMLASESLGDGRGIAICYRKPDGDCVSRVPSPVVRLGWDEDFISAAVGNAGDPGALEYYYIVRDFDGPRADKERVVRGSYDEAGFIEERRKHGVPGVAPITIRAD